MKQKMPKRWIIYEDNGRWYLALDGTGPGYIHVAGGTKEYCKRFFELLRKIEVHIGAA